jgi:N-acetylglucosaminyldiphosphoundecaprenol N-acetyl-beta-D-mannosaminyltransferase
MGAPAMASSDPPRPPSRHVLGMRVDATSYQDAGDRIVRWAREGESRYVCVSSVHGAVESYDDPSFRAAVNGADLITPDGMPLVWLLRLLGIPDAGRVYGPDLTPEVCRRAAAEGVPVGFYGGAPAVLDALVSRLRARLPELRVAYQWSPPFRPLSPEEDDEVVRAINESGARVLFVGLGCPKQERWMAAHRGRVRAAMVGVGAAFDFVAGTKRRAPRLLQRAGLEWAFRLACEPRRLGRRYLYIVPRFLAAVAVDLAAGRLGRPPGSHATGGAARPHPAAGARADPVGVREASRAARRAAPRLLGGDEP